MTVDNTPLSDEYSRYKFSDEDNHPNSVVDRLAMKKCCELNGCASGNGIRIVDAQYDINNYLKRNEYIKRGLLKIQRTMQPIVIPERLECVLCLNNGRGHYLEALQSEREDIESKIEYSQERIDKMQSDINDEEYSIEKEKEYLKEITEELNQAELEK